MIYILFSILVISLTAYLFFFRKESKTYTSPDGYYSLIIKKKSNLFKTTSPGDGGNYEVEIVLKNKRGNIIGESNSNLNCRVFNDSIEIEWDIKNDQVKYSRGKTINLKTGKVEC